jgi:hypothetical protein
VPLDAGHGGGEIELLRAVLQARRKRLRRPVRGAVGAVDGQGQKGNRGQGDRRRRPAAAQGRLAEHVAGAVGRRGPEKAARRLRPRRLSLAFGEKSAAEVAVDLGQLLAIEARFRIAPGCGGRLPRQGP